MSTSLPRGALRSSVRSALGLLSSFAICALACGQDSSSAEPKLEEVVVTGYRASLISALDEKRASSEMVDVINADDIASFPDANLAESLQRLPGVSIDRENGEGRSITVRGLGGDFTAVRLNGIDALSTAGGNEAGAAPNRSRGFDFNTFASELFSSLKVQKTASAATDEGSLGATIDMTTGRPLDYGERKLAFSTEGAYYENGQHISPRLSGLASDTWFDNRLGALVSVSYAERESSIDAYQRNAGIFDFHYRQSQHLGKTPNTFGFAQPGVGPGGTFGSNPVAYAQLNEKTIIPALGTLGHQDLSYERLGTTGTLQWRPGNKTLITADYVYSLFEQQIDSYQLTTVGLNRNGTNSRAQILTGPNGLRAAGTTNGDADRRAVYVRCDQSATIDCGQALNGTTLVPGMLFSYNPNNLDPYDYYNRPASRGYIADSNGIANYQQLLGRPGTQVVDAHVNEFNQADYLRLDNVDWRNAADRSENDTHFSQFSLNVNHEFTDRFRSNLVVGQSKSEFEGIGLLAEFNALDRDGFVYDERGGGSMPIYQLGFDPADATNWDLVKGLSSIRYVNRTVDNSFETVRLEFDFDVSDGFTVNFGGTARVYEYENSEARRNNNIEAINPTLREAGLTIGQLGRSVDFGKGLDLPAGAPTSWFAPDMDAFRSQFGIDCNCINSWADFRGGADVRQANAIEETSNSFYLQGSFDVEVFGRALLGNLGVRYAKTEVEGSGVIGTLPVTAENEYNDTLPSLNLSYEIMPDVLLRIGAAKVMSRPMLGSLTPGSTSFSTTCTAAGTAPNEVCAPGSNVPGVTMGNPYLKPFRANNYDLSVEWYFAEGGVVSAAWFRKDIGSFPQQLLGAGPLSSAIKGDAYDQLVASLVAAGTSPGTRALANYTQAGGEWAIRQFRDSPGGEIEGVEVSYQQNLSFLPAPFDGFGLQANYTHIDSDLSYITNSDTGASVSAPWANVSPDAFNATIYYEADSWEVRLSGAFRKEYVRQFPIATGNCDVGTTTLNGGPCNTPVFADFLGTDDTFNLDASASVQLSKIAKVTAEALNLTNQTTDRWMYGANHLAQTYGSTGRVFLLGLRATF